ncbi:DUF2000 domain-containing protein [Sinorhizobium sp. CCBAU 05631]|uniref:DUF2000 domain-containing protein n=1 Tax=Sinorhizobium sp. CCBAU 05631 TaxID=794846 RepID=UPI0004AC9335|nr:DUF2000 domain-containing protein [Sinorhizobium sp. CCBAU 05631]ASY60519.1 hypothetical protein SS05631_b64270 [Sinorhizobium sp. CCBAU 05631]
MTRCAFVIDHGLPRGLIANTAAMLAMTLGKERPDLVGHPVHDADGNRHQGITTIVMPMLMSDAAGLMELKLRAAAQEASGLSVIGVTESAQRAKSYEAYELGIGETRHDDLRYLGLCLHGPAKLVRSLTGDLPLMK